jgi:hypothetical protein
MQASSRHIHSSNTASIVDLLAEQDAQIDAQDNLKRTPLKLATLGYGQIQHYRALALFLVENDAKLDMAFVDCDAAKRFFGCVFDQIPVERLPVDCRREVKTKNLFGI